MSTIARLPAFGRSLAADDAAMSSIRLALIIGFCSSAVLVIVRIGAAAAMPGLAH